MNRNATKKLGGICLLFAITLSSAGAQPGLERTVVASGAVIGESAGAHLHATIGQAIVGRGANGSTDASLGFWMPRRPLKTSAVLIDESPDGAVTVSPNVCSAQTTITIPMSAAATLEITVIDALGRVVLRPATEVVESGAQRTTLDVSALAPGRYQAVVDDGRTRRVARFIVVR
jgi:hypothetical protein